MKELRPEEWARLQEIREEMLDLFEDAKDIVRKAGGHEYDRARSYWMAYLENALDDANSITMPCTIGDTIVALEPFCEDEDDTDEESDDAGVITSNALTEAHADDTEES